MIRTYKFYLSCHIMLHQHIIAFFNRIEFETGDFDDGFFEPDFLDIVRRHPQILRQRSIDIYNEVKTWSQADRSALCEQIRASNDIENICKGNYKPGIIDRKANGFWKNLRDFFLDLYSQVLDGDGFRDKYHTALREHFNGFSEANEGITKCPICGIGELKKKEDECRDQYDHFLPKALYPLSSVNFENLVPSCKECNSFDAKGEEDTIGISTGKLFFPYDIDHKGISFEFHITKDDVEIENIVWKIDFSNPDGKTDEITSWRKIYRIDSRYEGFIKARIRKWYKHYWITVNGKRYQCIPEVHRDSCYFEFLENDEEIELDFLRLPSLIGFLKESILAQAQLEASVYS